MPASSVRYQLEEMSRSGLLDFRADLARPLAGWPVSGMLWIDAPDTEVARLGEQFGGWPETRFAASMIGPASIMLVVSLRAPDDLLAIAARVAECEGLPPVVDRRIVYRLDKVHGRILDDLGRSSRAVAIDPWLGHQLR